MLISIEVRSPPPGDLGGNGKNAYIEMLYIDSETLRHGVLYFIIYLSEVLES